MYKYHALFSPLTLQAFEDGPDRGFRNVGQYKPDAGNTPKSGNSYYVDTLINNCTP
jgi:hypothetical protein